MWPAKTQVSLVICAFFADRICSLQPLGKPKKDKRKGLSSWCMKRLIWVFVDHTGLIVGFVVHWLIFCSLSSSISWVWLSEAKVLCILRHWGVQMILAYTWGRPPVLAAGKGRGGMFLFFSFTFIHFPFSPVPLFHLLFCLFYLSSPFLLETIQNDPQGLTCR